MALVISAKIPSGVSLEAVVDDLVKMEELNFGNSPLHQPRQELELMVTCKENLFVGVYSGSQLVGYCIGTPIVRFSGKHQIIGSTFPPDYDRGQAIYVESLELLPEFQHNGHGSKLFRQFIAEAKAQNFLLIAGHAREGSSYKLVSSILRKGILVDFSVQNHLGTGETYHYILAKLP